MCCMLHFDIVLDGLRREGSMLLLLHRACDVRYKQYTDYIGGIATIRLNEAIVLSGAFRWKFGTRSTHNTAQNAAGATSESTPAREARGRRCLPHGRRAF